LHINVTFTLSTGGTYTNSTREYDTLDDFQAVLERFVGQSDGSLTWHCPDGAKQMLASAHIVAAMFGPAAEQ
jgi:hypothetical protein